MVDNQKNIFIIKYNLMSIQTDATEPEKLSVLTSQVFLMIYFHYI